MLHCFIDRSMPSDLNYFNRVDLIRLFLDTPLTDESEEEGEGEPGVEMIEPPEQEPISLDPNAYVSMFQPLEY